MTTPELHWPAAAATAIRLAPPGPRVGDDQAKRAITDLQRFARDAQGLVRETARIDAPTDTAPVIVADRTMWVRANVESLSALVPGRAEQTTTGMLAGAQIGGVLAWLSTKVLGQFDVFVPSSAAPDGRLLLVAPNIVQAETQLGVDPKDFRLWVCLHEETHRVQFTAFPWLREHLREQARVVAGLTDMAAPGWQELARIVTGRGVRNLTLLDLLPDTVDVKSTLERVTAVMSLLEGHADVVMDRVGPRVIRSVGQIRSRFETRRDGRPGLDRIVRRLLGMDVKLAQYRDGAKFCRHVIAAVGIEGLNRAFESAETLPLLAEIHDPARWLKRMEA
ncbi:zinc-dependent metalloprotease [Granulicoccus sp. GXG6511]|uniref:zinc-dependent metalloprotease n=1 Tax=Granulicoccus sp. GXG6511 TaxID=3381351 RepID=UPI003D7C78D0